MRFQSQLFTKGKAIGKVIAVMFVLVWLTLAANASAARPPGDGQASPRFNPGAEMTGADPLPMPPTPGILPPQAERARVRSAMELVWSKYQETLAGGDQATIGEITLEGNWAYGAIEWPAGDVAIGAPIYMVAHRSAGGAWQALAPDHDGLFPQWAAAMPDTLLTGISRDQITASAGALSVQPQRQKPPFTRTPMVAETGDLGLPAPMPVKMSNAFGGVDAQENATMSPETRGLPEDGPMATQSCTSGDHSGVEHCQMNGIDIIKINLNDPSITIRPVIAPGGGLATLSSLAGGSGIAAINADYRLGSCSNGVNCGEGLTYVDGNNYTMGPPDTYNYRRSLGFNQSLDPHIGFPSEQGGYQWHTLGGGPRFTENGAFRWVCGDGSQNRDCPNQGGTVVINDEYFGSSATNWWNRAQSAIGYSDDGNTLFFAASAGSVTVQSMHDVLWQHGARNNLKLDGGSARSLYYNDGPGSYLYLGSGVTEPSAWVVYHQEAPPGQVRLYDNTNYSGDYAYVDDPGLYTVANTFNDRAESIQMPDGWSVRLFLNDDYYGPQVCIRGDDSDLWNNHYDDGSVAANSATWLEVYNQSDCPTIDSSPPEAHWLAPVGDEEVYVVGNETIRLEATATDNVAVATVYFVRWDAVNEQWVDIGQDSSAPYGVDLDTSALNPQWNQVNVYAVDTSGNWSDSPHIWLNKTDCPGTNEPDNIPAEATLLAYGQVSEAAICPSADVDYYRFSGLVGDGVVIDIDAISIGSSLDSRIFLIDSDGITVLAENDDAAGSFDSKLGYKLLHDGDYYIKVQEFSHPNVGGPDYNYSLSLTIDATDPTAEITAPDPGAWLEQGLATIQATAGDTGSGIHRVEFLWHDADWNIPDWVWLGADYDGQDGWSLDFDTGAVPEQQGGAFYIWAFDWPENWGGDGVYGLGIDRTSPAVSAYPAPVYDDAPFRDFWIHWDNGSDNLAGVAEYDVQIRDGAAGTWIDLVGGVTETSHHFVGEDGHTYYMRARARDYAGNQSDYAGGDGDSFHTVDICPAQVDSHEPDDEYGSATWVQTDGTAQTHNSHVEDDQDWVKFTATAGLTYTLSTANTGGHADTHLYLYEADGNTLIADNDDYPGMGLASRIDWLAPESGTYYARVSHGDPWAYGCTTEYTLMVESADQDAPSISVSPSSLSSTLFPDQQVDQQLTIGNEGAANLIWTIDEAGASCAAPEDLAWIGVAPDSGSLAPGGNSQANVTFTSAGMVAGDYAGLLCLNSNDPETPRIEVPIALRVQESATWLAIEPRTATVPVSQSLTIDIVVGDVANLYGAELALSFDPGLMNVVDADAGKPGVQITPGNCPAADFVVQNGADNVSGVITYAVTSLSPSTPCAGGVVASITFHGLAEGASLISFTNWLLSDSSGQLIPVSDIGHGSLTIEPNLGLIQGNVQLQGRSDHAGALITAWSGGASVASTQSDSTGAYMLQLQAGNYDVTVSMTGYLAGQKEGVAVGAGEETSLPTVTLIGGNATGDAAIDILDLSLIGSHFGLVCGDPDWDPRADINGDCKVDILDLTIAGANYGATAPVPW